MTPITNPQLRFPKIIIPYPDKMKALQYTKYNEIKLVVLDTPKVTSPYDIIVKVHASSLNGKIQLLQSPIVLGLDFSGVIVAKGNSPEVNRFFLNDPVMGTVITGIHAEFIKVDVRKDTIEEKPYSITHQEAATIPSCFLQVLWALYIDEKQKPHKPKILIIGASEGLGTLEIQVAKQLFDANVTAICSSEHIELAKSLGADFAYDEKESSNELLKTQNNFDIIFNVIGYNDKNYPKYRSLLKKNGIYVTTVGKEKLTYCTYIRVTFSTIYRKLIGLFTSTKYRIVFAKNHKDFKNGLTYIERREIRSFISKEFDLKDSEKAFELLEQEGYGVGYYTYKWIIYPLYLSPLCKIPGPPTDHFLLGNFVGVPQIKWTKDYGGIICYRGLFNEPRISITDPQALQKVLVSDVYDYRKPIFFSVKKILGEGIVLAEGDVHRQIGHLLKEIWIKELVDNKESKIDLMPYISKATLDIIGKVGFNCQFNSLTSECELVSAYHMLLNSGQKLIILLSNLFKIIHKLPIKHNYIIKEATKIIEKESSKLVNEGLERAKRGNLQGNDILSVLIKRNEEEKDNEKMSFDELKYQIMTFLVAGHETSSVAIGWGLYHLSKDKESQDLLRKELINEFPDPNFIPTFDQINKLEYLNAVVKETLRVDPPAPVVLRVSNKDDFIGGYFIPKGTTVIIPINTIHKLPSIWGPDSNEFKPSRWLDPSISSSNSKINSNYSWIPFLTGARSCIASKMALNEVKVLLAILIRNLEFRDEGQKIKKKLALVSMPDPGVTLWVKKVDTN
ncbi:8352_t:CDS:10 [Diversispora eburnea]|uniref:8352_t:CDS:1 n=1 Tax=Diversispora eburnea TaxID=1213867 RepID=A0A9N8W3F1_9GLOM|nr:8352_t:CDS:10 [Diversispora eburnea]